ncbi:MAG: hypothetical protein V3R37_04445, partial [Rhodospirillales bacterium]
ELCLKKRPYSKFSTIFFNEILGFSPNLFRNGQGVVVKCPLMTQSGHDELVTMYLLLWLIARP